MGLHRPIRGREAGGTIAASLAFGAWLAAGILLAVLLTAEPLHSQERIDPAEVSARTSPYVPPSQYRLRTEATLVEVGVVVRDRRGGTVGGLQKGDFEIRDEGRKRNVTFFSVHTFAPSGRQETRQTRPRFVGLLFDDLNSNLAELKNSQVAATRFVTQGLAAGDQVAVFTTGAAQITPFTGDVGALTRAIDSLKVGQRIIDGGSCPRMTGYDGYLISEKRDSASLEVKVNEALRCSPGLGGGSRGPTAPIPLRQLSRTSPVVLAVLAQAGFVWGQVRAMSQATLGTIRNIVDHMSKQPGDRLLVLASGGFLAGSLEREQEDIIGRALRGDVVISSIDAKGLFTADAIEGTPGGYDQSISRAQALGVQSKEQGNDALVYLAQSTGGLFFHNNNDLVRGFRELAMLPEVTYVLGFSPGESPDGKLHKLSVRVGGGRNYSVQARPGYFAVASDSGQPPSERRIDREVLSNTVLAEVPATLTALAGGIEAGGTGLASLLHVDVSRLALADRNGSRIQQLRFIVALLDERGEFVTGREGILDLALKEATYARLSEGGVNVRLTMEAAPGTYRLRFVVEEPASGKLTASTEPVEVR